MAGTVDVVLRCLTGMRARGQVLRFDPALPPEVKQLRFSVHYRGHRIDVTLAEDRMHLRSRPGPALPIKVRVRDQEVELAPGGHSTRSRWSSDHDRRGVLTSCRHGGVMRAERPENSPKSHGWGSAARGTTRQTLLILGASGDLSARLLLPGLGGCWPPPEVGLLLLVGSNRHDWDDDRWRERVAESFAAGQASGPQVDAVARGGAPGLVEALKPA